MRYKYIDLAVAVVGGIGTSQFNHQCRINRVSVQAPSGAAAYDFEFTEPGGHGVVGAEGNVGNNVLPCDAICSAQPVTLTITGTDGRYIVRCTVEHLG